MRIESLPADAPGAARSFLDDCLPRVAEELAGHDALAIVLPTAPYDHDDWRRAAARDLARAHAPQRVNIVAGNDETAIAATLEYLAKAPGVTGQLLRVGSQDEGNGSD